MSEAHHDDTPPTLDPIGLPLTGSRLIEASAGTGKTFTIALLYVRLVLGPRSPDDTASFPRALTPPEILVVTFTNAATQELRDRIRARLVEAAEVFLQTPEAAPTDASTIDAEDVQGEPGAGRSEGLFPGMEKVAPKDGFTAPLQRPAPGATTDPLIALRDSYPRENWPAMARRLQLAAEWMDEAAVSTIHSWCYRMLREHAFDSGSLFSLNLETDQSELELEVARDYWRSFYYALSRDDLEIVTQYWDTPDALNAAVARLRDDAAALPTAPPPADSLARVRKEQQRRLDELKAPWPEWVDELAQLFDEGQQAKAFAGNKMRKDHRNNWLGALREWATTPGQVSPALTDAAWKRLTPEGIAEIWKESPPEHPAFAAFKDLPSELDSLPDAYSDLLAHAVHWMAERREQAQQRRAEMGPHDLLTHLDRALAGPTGDTLAERIRSQFPVALVDEFQDTDPIQYRLFDRVYRLAQNADEDTNASAVFLIGDPKQAIYAFRGADIHTYLQARRDTAGRHVTLGTNFRSSRPMVDAINRCFQYAEDDPRGQGAFLFRDANGDNPVPFVGVNAKGRKDSLTREGQPLPALTLWHLDAEEPLAKTAYLAEMAERCASHMTELLSDAQAGRVGFTAPDGFTPLAPSDLAVLVNNGGEARAIRTALARRGIKSVYLSDKEGVFESPAAGELETWLRAASAPDDDRALRAALASPSLGLSLAELDELNHNELAWEARVLQFRDYHRLWQRQGVLPMLRRMMADFQVPTRLLTAANALEGERRLTDLLHLGELLQQTSLELDGEHALTRYLAETRANPLGQDDTHRLRLESDADLVQVITIHKSKGLEYPLVFLPFIGAHRETKAKDTPLRWHDDDGNARVSLTADDTILARADRERLGEDLRKLYVALTRARHATWLGLAPLKGLENSAIAQLLNAGEPIAPQALRATLDTLRGDCDAIAVEDAPPIGERRVAWVDETAPLAPARTPARRAREHWWIASYSALRAGIRQQALAPELVDLDADDTDALQLTGDHAEPTTALEATAREIRDEFTEGPPGPAVNERSEGSLHQFQRGPAAGTFLHGLLEWAGHQGFERLPEQPDALSDTLARRANLRGWQQWIPALESWLWNLLATELPLPEQPDGTRPSLRLDRLSRYQVEMEFWFAAHDVDTRALDAPVSTYILPGAPRPALDTDILNGMLKGFIDLVVEHEGRYYVLDWKSNHLGPDDDAYTPEAMAGAVLEKRYDLQYALYTLALHRLLKSRLPDYDYERHVGGVAYVFLRGMHAPSRGVHRERPPRELIERLDALFQASPSTRDTEGASA
ncbi:exodeoxyribonuclease V subunit beta [Aidingimonas halophila]|uniref:RecBCD enzyme subunit RecB n=1 Tax=Aidingimonas halophila TaxID=574349 RepID=A0A1H2SUY0_9GAMM|nr:exodeoxyribonuclease V subunit beta [Aidingimonas halophila]GHC17079.1 RecBCD enzyme subunit RecB [Aidingimonas halophila]SDW35476.1 DNA helicase/exodeoxyribonuclease V, beta subunit [Aidingimonas halophila]